jgi:pSer/pThr/pTyr-binding forkhead associated (FHA) protein
VSRRHAAITVTASAVTIEDLGSHNGTFVNDRRLVDGPTPLVEGDEIRVGPARMVVHAASPADLTRTASTTD